MAPLRKSPLFSAVVLAGASLTAVETACGGSETTPGPSDASTASSSSSGGSSSSSSSSGSTADASKADGADAATDTGDPSDACPPDSEIPVPPCVFIR